MGRIKSKAKSILSIKMTSLMDEKIGEVNLVHGLREAIEVVDGVVGTVVEKVEGGNGGFPVG